MYLTKNILFRLSFIDKEIRSGLFPNKTTLSKKYEISLKTIQRDIDYLRNNYDAPIEYNFKRKGFFYGKPFLLNPLELSEGDFFMLAITEKVLRQYNNSPYEKNIKVFFEKIKNLFNNSISIYIEELEDIMSFEIGPLREINKEYFDKIEKAIKENNIVEITYHSNYSGVVSNRKIDPLRLINYKGDWYLIAYCHLKKCVRMFALSRIKKLILKDIPFKPHFEINIDEILKTSFGIYIDNKIYTVKIKFSSYESRWIKERKWHHSQKIKEIKDGSIILTMKINNIEEIKRWVLQYGKECEVLAPRKLREEIKTELEEARKKYK